MKHLLSYLFIAVVPLTTASAGKVDAGLATGSSVTTVVSGVVGTPAAGLVVGGATTVGEIGISYMCGLLGFRDPPDLVNYAQRADPPLLIPLVGDDPLASADLNSAAQAYIAAVSAMVQSARGMRLSQDRLAGALTVGTPADVANQRQWLSEFRTQAIARYLATKPFFSSFVALVNAEFPIWTAMTVTTDDIKAVRDAEMAGFFGAFGEEIINAWQLDAYDREIIQQQVGRLTNATIDSIGNMTVGEGLGLMEATCTGCIPEPSTAALLVIPLAVLITSAWRRRRSA
jgi:hypothetical protein